MNTVSSTPKLIFGHDDAITIRSGVAKTPVLDFYNSTLLDISNIHYIDSFSSIAANIIHPQIVEPKIDYEEKFEIVKKDLDILQQSFDFQGQTNHTQELLIKSYQEKNKMLTKDNKVERKLHRRSEKENEIKDQTIIDIKNAHKLTQKRLDEVLLKLSSINIQ